MSLPSIFIASSGEAYELVETLADLLQAHADVTPWNADVFEPGRNGIDSLVGALEAADFGVFFLIGDDTLTVHGASVRAPRDNVVLELGLFMGMAGKERCFSVRKSGEDVKVPSDLDGVTHIDFRIPANGSLKTALTPTARRIKEAVRVAGPRTRAVHRKIYWCAPHGNPRNLEAQRFLEASGISVNMPGNFIPAPALGGRDRRRSIRTECMRLIRESDLVVVDLDSYGLDSAWEMGFAEGHGIPVVGVTRSSGSVVDEPRLVHKREFSDNIMHGWDDAKFVSTELDEVIGKCSGLHIHVSCPFKHQTAIDAIRGSSLARTASHVVFPRDTVKVDPRTATGDDYSVSDRTQTVRSVADCDALLVVLPRYGMDTAWKLGYAAALDKQLVGWISDDYSKEASFGKLYDHWVHGWKQHTWFPNLDDLASYCRGFG